DVAVLPRSLRGVKHRSLRESGRCRGGAKKRETLHGPLFPILRNLIGGSTVGVAGSGVETGTVASPAFEAAGRHTAGAEEFHFERRAQRWAYGSGGKAAGMSGQVSVSVATSCNVTNGNGKLVWYVA